MSGESVQVEAMASTKILGRNVPGGGQPGGENERRESRRRGGQTGNRTTCYRALGVIVRTLLFILSK